MAALADKTVAEITDIRTDSFTLRYEGVTETERVLRRDVVAIVPKPSDYSYETPEVLLLFLQSSREDAPSTQNGDEQSPPNASVNHLATRRMPRPVAAALAEYSIYRLPSHLDAANPPQLHIIVSTKSGACDAVEFFDNVVKPVFELLGFTENPGQAHSYKVHRTSSERSILELAANTIGPQANSGKQQTILLLSGDGGPIDIINGVSVISRGPQYVSPTLGLLALGTGNALANSSGLNNDGTKGLSAFLFGKPKSLPTFSAKFSPGTEILSNEGQEANLIPNRDASGVGTLYGVVVASWGVHASLVADSDTTDFRKFGTERFSMAGKELLFPSDGSEPHLYQGKVTLRQQSGGGEEYNVNWDRQNHTYLLATFVSNLEKGLTISPRSKPLDGQLRILHFGKLPSEDIMSIFGLAYDGGKHTELDVVGYEPIEGFRIDFAEREARWRRVCVDGKIVRVSEGGYMDVRKMTEGFVNLMVNA